MRPTTQNRAVLWMSPPPLVGGIFALAAGLGIAWADSRPTWDDTGVTAAAIVSAAGLAALAGVRPWLAPVLVAAPVVLAEISGGFGVLLAIPFACAGGFAGAFVRRRFAAG